MSKDGKCKRCKGKGCEACDARVVSADKVYHESYVHYYHAEAELKHLAGKVLTIIDASIQDPEQKKAIKDLIKTSISKAMYNLQDIAWDRKQGHSVTLDDYKNYV